MSMATWKCWESASAASSGGISFALAVFSGGDISFTGAQFSASYITFSGAQFSGGEVSFRAEFSGATINFSGAQFSASKVDFSGAGDWSEPPRFSWVSPPPAGVKLPAAIGSEKPIRSDSPG